jgi:hypothetical protein
MYDEIFKKKNGHPLWNIIKGRVAALRYHHNNNNNNNNNNETINCLVW